MSDISALSELARFAGASPLTGEDELSQRRLATAIVRSALPRGSRRSVSELLGVVLALSARARRAALPEADVELDVFGPAGQRAVRMFLPQKI